MTKTVWAERKVFLTPGEDVFNMLVAALLVTFLVWFAQYQWKRRRVYQMIGHRKGPLALPFIGSALYFAGSTTEFLNKMYGVCKKFEQPVPIWVCNHLYVGIWKTKELEAVLKSPHALSKDRVYELVEFIVGTGLFTAPASKWKRHRKIILPTFSSKILEGYVEIFSEQSEVLSKQLEKALGKENLDIFDVISRYSLDILCETIMGVTINAQTSDCDFFKWVSRLTELASVRIMRNMYLPDFIVRQSSLWKAGMEDLKKFHSFTETVVKEKKLAYQRKLKGNEELSETCFEEGSSKRRTFLEQLIELSEEGTKFTDEELREEVATFLIAGSDTTSTVNSFVLTMLGMFPDVQHKVYQEVIDVLGPDRRVEYKDLNNFPYLERVIKETMRFFPAGTFLFRSITGDIKLDDCTIPAGSSVAMSILAVHRDPEVWPDPLKFDPDRFLPEEVAKRHPYSYLPFSGGLRHCPGINFAMMSMKTALATIVRRYKFYTGYKNIEEIKLKFDMIVKSVDGFKVSLKKR